MMVRMRCSNRCLKRIWAGENRENEAEWRKIHVFTDSLTTINKHLTRVRHCFRLLQRVTRWSEEIVVDHLFELILDKHPQSQGRNPKIFWILTQTHQRQVEELKDGGIFEKKTCVFHKARMPGWIANFSTADLEIPSSWFPEELSGNLDHYTQLIHHLRTKVTWTNPQYKVNSCLDLPNLSWFFKQLDKYEYRLSIGWYKELLFC